MRVIFLHGGYGSYEKRAEIEWPDDAPIPRIGEMVSIEISKTEEIDGEVKRVTHQMELKAKRPEIRIRLA